ncbi:WAS/WASL-interacting protein family member 2-like [Haemorhous mexicanus]|uniref:WAS/WASL-interacting protein family member 2-like n=1 Tax=Haemorhous mexicanus TaxID=30427 RepID=UPI0028BF4038|nr:WAS/WASL-interacting protein family member 2-like [Haemorhous mexicanus]
MDGARRASPATGCRGDGGGHSPERAGVAATPQRPAASRPAGLDASAQPRRSRPVPHLEPARGAQHLRTAPPVTPGALFRAPPCASQRGLTRPPSLRGYTRWSPCARHRQRDATPLHSPQSLSRLLQGAAAGQALATTPSSLVKRDRGSAPPTGSTTGRIRASVLCNYRPPRLSPGRAGVIRWRGGGGAAAAAAHVPPHTGSLGSVVGAGSPSAPAPRAHGGVPPAPPNPALFRSKASPHVGVPPPPRQQQPPRLFVCARRGRRAPPHGGQRPRAPTPARAAPRNRQSPAPPVRAAAPGTHQPSRSLPPSAPAILLRGRLAPRVAGARPPSASITPKPALNRDLRLIL